MVRAIDRSGQRTQTGAEQQKAAQAFEHLQAKTRAKYLFDASGAALKLAPDQWKELRGAAAEIFAGQGRRVTAQDPPGVAITHERLPPLIEVVKGKPLDSDPAKIVVIGAGGLCGWASKVKGKKTPRR